MRPSRHANANDARPFDAHSANQVFVKQDLDPFKVNFCDLRSVLRPSTDMERWPRTVFGSPTKPHGQGQADGVNDINHLLEAYRQLHLPTNRIFDSTNKS